VVDILQWRAQYQDDRLAYRFLVDGESEEICLTYAALDQRARALAAKLQSLEKRRAGALLLYLPGLDFIVAYWGCLYSGVMAIPVYPLLRSRADRTLPKMIRIVNDAEPAFVLTTLSLSNTTKGLLAQIPKLKDAHCIATDKIDAEDWADEWRKPAISRDTLAFLQYTSGSTTSPKGVMLSHGNLMHNLAVIEKCFEHSAASCGVSWLPLSRYGIDRRYFAATLFRLSGDAHVSRAFFAAPLSLATSHFSLPSHRQRRAEFRL
jgi:acyl-CoA synthetase (AMP-forming)/AMP-acid ligase II